jgi:hypothetical protein
MSKWRTALVVATVAGLTLVSSPALAAQATVEDQAGDAIDDGLDITSVRVRNLDYAVVAEVRFVDTVRGDLIVSIDPRKARGLRLVSKYRPGGHTRNTVLTGAFSDRQSDGVENTVLRCKGFRVSWSTDEPLARLRIPARCLHRGNYGAIRFAALTEGAVEDTDYAPDTSTGVSDWVPRG